MELNMPLMARYPSYKLALILPLFLLVGATLLRPDNSGYSKLAHRRVLLIVHTLTAIQRLAHLSGASHGVHTLI
jgi:hypothetical protein